MNRHVEVSARLQRLPRRRKPLVNRCADSGLQGLQNGRPRPGNRPAGRPGGPRPPRRRPIFRCSSPHRHGRRSRPDRRRGTPCSSASASSAEPVSVVTTCSAATDQGSPGNAARAAAIAGSGWRTCTIPSARMKCAPSSFAAQNTHRVPMRGFPRDQRLGMAGAIEQQIGAEIFRDVVGDGIDAIDHASTTLLAKRVSGMVRGLMVSLCAFHSAAIASAISAGRRDDLAAGRRADRLAVQRDGKPAIGSRDAGTACRSACAGERASRAAPPPPDRAAIVRRLHRIVHASRIRLPQAVINSGLTIR